MATALFIDAETLKRNTIIDGSVDPDKFMQFIRLAQQIHIQDILGTKLYERLQAGIIADDLTANETTLIDDYIQDCLIHYASAEFTVFSSFGIFNGGVFKHTSENAQTTSSDEVDKLAKMETSYAEYFRKRLIDYLCVNSTLFPEYSTNVDNDIYPNKTMKYTGGWHLTGSSSKKINRWDI